MWFLDAMLFCSHFWDPGPTHDQDVCAFIQHTCNAASVFYSKKCRYCCYLHNIFKLFNSFNILTILNKLIIFNILAMSTSFGVRLGFNKFLALYIIYKHLYSRRRLQPALKVNVAYRCNSDLDTIISLQLQLHHSTVYNIQQYT